MLRLYQSNRLEDLAAMLQKVQQTKPLSEPLLPEEIIVQSQGMRRFIGNYLAEHGGIAANIRFSLPAGFNWRLTRACCPTSPNSAPSTPKSCAGGCWGCLFQTASPAPKPRRRRPPSRATSAAAARRPTSLPASLPTSSTNTSSTAPTG